MSTGSNEEIKRRTAAAIRRHDASENHLYPAGSTTLPRTSNPDLAIATLTAALPIHTRVPASHVRVLWWPVINQANELGKGAASTIAKVIFRRGSRAMALSHRFPDDGSREM
jgi:hypothetical protein